MDRERVEVEVGESLDRHDLDGAMTALLRGYGRELLGYLAAVLRDPDLADDAFAQLSEDLWSGIAAFRRESTARTWAYRIAWHVALRVLEDPFRRRGERLETSRWSELVDEVRASTAAHLRTENKDRIARLRESLKSDEQTLLVLRLDRDLSWREIAIVMAEDGVAASEASLRKRFERIKERLRELATAEGLLP